MTNLEFSNEFDVLYNNITSNQAPGLDEYEKSVFLTRAQDEIIKAYFNPRTNKTQQGFDGNERRQIDFSMIMRSNSFKTLIYLSDSTGVGTPTISKKELDFLVTDVKKDYINGEAVIPDGAISKVFRIKDITEPELNNKTATVVTYLKEALFDSRDNSKSVGLNKDILIFTNEYVIVSRGEKNQKVRLTVMPINYTEYNRLMSKPYKRPLKFNAWRLIDNSNSKNVAELIVGPNDTITQYSIRYIKKPKPIILQNLEDDLTIDNESTSSPCELDSILHPEILQRAVELAKSAYLGDLNSQIALGQTSHTEMGMVTQNSNYDK